LQHRLFSLAQGKFVRHGGERVPQAIAGKCIVSPLSVSTAPISRISEPNRALVRVTNEEPLCPGEGVSKFKCFEVSTGNAAHDQPGILAAGKPDGVLRQAGLDPGNPPDWLPSAKFRGADDGAKRNADYIVHAK